MTAAPIPETDLTYVRAVAELDDTLRVVALQRETITALDGECRENRSEINGLIVERQELERAVADLTADLAAVRQLLANIQAAFRISDAQMDAITGGVQ